MSLSNINDWITMSIKKVKKWANKKLGLVSLALANVEKNALNQKGESLSSDAEQVQRHSQGQLADDLLQGKLTQEVINLRWRIYKTLEAGNNYTSEIIGYDEDNYPIIRVKKIDKTQGLESIKLDSYDPYDLEMVIDNSEITKSVNETLENKYLNLSDAPTLNEKKDKVVSATHGEISSTDFFATQKNETPLIVSRKEAPKFKLEKYTKKLNVRNISDTKKLLEFYVSKYPDESITSSFFIRDVKKAIKNPMTSSILDIDTVGFFTNNTLGADDFLEYKYKILSFDKIIEFNEFYVFKFIAEPIVNGRYVLENYRVEELDEKYKKKEKRKNK